MIAISYRREDSLSIAGRLYDRLEQRFGKKSVFMDFDSIRPGFDFRDQIRETIKRSHVVIAMIGSDWLGQQKDGSRRIDDPADFVRIEVAAALSRGIPVVPVLIDDTEMPKQEFLPTDMQALVFRHALPLDSGLDFRQHADRLISSISEIIPPRRRTWNNWYRNVAILAIGGAVLCGLAIAARYFVRPSTKPTTAVTFPALIDASTPNTASGKADCPKGNFALQSKATDLVLDLGRDRVSGTLLLIQLKLTRSETQIWTTIPSEQAGYCYIVTKYSTSRASDECLEIKRGQPDDRIGLGPRRQRDAGDQLWAINEVEPGYYVIISRHTGKAIDIAYGEKKEGLVLGFFSPHKGNNQLWKLLPL